MSRLVVHRAGLLTTIQDEGRRGFQHLGVPAAGPMDPWSHRVSNLMVGNSRDAATLEITATGPDLTFEREVRVSIAGARFSGEVDGESWTSPVSLTVPAGGCLTFRSRDAGMRAYLAVAGGFDVPLVMGSRATDVRSRLGGLNGRALRDGDVLSVGAAPYAAQGTPGRTAPALHPQRHPEHPAFAAVGLTSDMAARFDVSDMAAHFVSDVAAHFDVSDVAAGPCAPPYRLRVERGPHEGALAQQQFEQLLASMLMVSPKSDRMGYRLTGATIPADAGALISMPTVTGLVQVPQSGEPILLMADRQTTGGYSPVAVVIAADLPIAGQLGPGDAVIFERCESAAALKALIAQERALLALERK